MTELKKRTVYKASPISEQAYLELQKKYGFPVEQLRNMARELKMGRPKLEMHLIYITLQQKKIREDQYAQKKGNM
jgi:hypothetical protein